MADRPSDLNDDDCADQDDAPLSDAAYGQAFRESMDVRCFDNRNSMIEWIEERAREIDAAPINPTLVGPDDIWTCPLPEHWRRAVIEGCEIKSFIPSAAWLEKRARELAREER